MMPDAKLSKIFAKFAGREVAVREEPYKLNLKNLGMTVEGVNCYLEDKNPVIRELEKEAAQHGLGLRIWLPESAGTCDWVDTRLNVDIAKEADGKYRIGSTFRLG